MLQACKKESAVKIEGRPHHLYSVLWQLEEFLHLLKHHTF